MSLLLDIPLLIWRSPLLIAGLVWGFLCLAVLFLVPDLCSAPLPPKLNMITACSVGRLALVLIGGGILDVLVRVIPQRRRET